MSKTSSTVLIETLRRRFRGLEKSRAQVELLLTKGHVTRDICETLYAGLFLRAFGDFEGYIEDLFVEMVHVKTTSMRGAVKPRVSAATVQAARDVIFSGKPYADWFPYDRTEVKARIFFKGGGPFCLEQQDKDELARIHKIRNAIAHRSRYSRSMFEKHVVGTTPLPPRERTPEGFLRGQHSSAPPATRYETIVAGLLQIATKLRC